MKKISLLIFIALFQTTFIFSQINNRSNFSFTVGPAIPIGHFANTNLYDGTSGFAKTGEAISFSYDRPIAKKLSFLINLSGQRNPINKSAFESSFSKAKIYQGFTFGSDPNNPPIQTNAAIYPNWKFEKSSWLYAALQLGGKAQFPLNEQKNIHFIANATIGALYAKSPDLKGSSTTDTATANITQSSRTGFGLIYSLGGGIQYQVNQRVFLTTTLNYTGTNNITIKNIKSTLTTTKGAIGASGSSVQQSTTTANGKQSISSLNCLIGFGISF